MNDREKLQKKITKAYVENDGRNVEAIPWDTLFNLLFDLMSGVCPAKDVKTFVKDHPTYAKGTIRRQMLDEGLSRNEAKLIAECCVVGVNATSAPSLEAAARQ